MALYGSICLDTNALMWLHVNNLINGLHKQISWKNCLYADNLYFTLHSWFKIFSKVNPKTSRILTMYVDLHYELKNSVHGTQRYTGFLLVSYPHLPQ